MIYKKQTLREIKNIVKPKKCRKGQKHSIPLKKAKNIKNIRLATLMRAKNIVKPKIKGRKRAKHSIPQKRQNT